MGARSRHYRGSIIGEFMRKARIKQVEVGKWKLMESVESFLRFALRDSNFSNALFKVTIGDWEKWRQCLVEEAFSLAREKRGFICIDYGDPSTMRSCSMCVDARSGLLTLFGNGELIGFILSECGV